LQVDPLHLGADPLGNRPSLVLLVLKPEDPERHAESTWRSRGSRRSTHLSSQTRSTMRQIRLSKSEANAVRCHGPVRPCPGGCIFSPTPVAAPSATPEFLPQEPYYLSTKSDLPSAASGRPPPWKRTVLGTSPHVLIVCSILARPVEFLQSTVNCKRLVADRPSRDIWRRCRPGQPAAFRLRAGHLRSDGSPPAGPDFVAPQQIERPG
jgi:hypothetical protein